jgi:nicotinamidase/pyrazinamidase
MDGLDFVMGEDYVINKGQIPSREEYSGFDAILDGSSILDDLLRDLDIDTVHVCGLATDYCVKETVLGAMDYGYNAVLLSNAIKPVDFFEGDEVKALGEMVRAGTQVI